MNVKAGVGGEDGLQGGGDSPRRQRTAPAGTKAGGERVRVVDGGVQGHKGSPGKDYGRLKDA